MTPTCRRVTARCWFAACCLLAVGCAAPRTSTPTVDPATLPDDAFQAYLGTMDVITVDEAYRAMLILADGEDTSKSFEARRDKLESRGIARPQWKLRPENVIDAGSTAYMVCQVCDVRAGLNRMTLGKLGIGDRRYALRELIYRGMISDMVEYQYMTGAEFVSMLAKADALMAKKGLYPTQGVDLSDETDRDEKGELIVPKGN
jgi:hypothetical protein